MTTRPNILFFLPDQLRADWVGPQNAGRARTPNVDALMARGVTFSNAICPSPLCGLRAPGNGDGECVATLATVLAALKPSSVGIGIEIKTDPLSTPYPQLEEKVIALLDEYDLRSRVRFFCFVPEILERVRELWPQASVASPFHRPTVQMLGGVVKAIERYRSIPGCIINVERSILENCYERCLDLVEPGCLGVGGVHEEKDLRLWLPRQVTQLATNFPDRAVSIRKELGLAERSQAKR